MEGKGFVYAGDLEPGNILVTEAGGCVMVSSARADETVSAENTVTVYNFEVEDWHTYYAGEWCVLVHNMCATAGADGGKYSALGEMSEADGQRYTEWSYEKIKEISVHNTDSDSMTLGKYFDGTLESGSYVAKARESGDMYFDMGSSLWNDVKNGYDLSDGEMFDIFNKNALDYAVENGKGIRFSQDPIKFGGALLNEWDYLKSEYGYKRLKPKGGYLYATK